MQRVAFALRVPEIHVANELLKATCRRQYSNIDVNPVVIPFASELKGSNHGGRSWRHLTGKQLDCFTCISEDAQKDPLEDAAPVSSVTATAGDGGVAAASATLQSDAAKQDLGDDEDAEMGEHKHFPVFCFEADHECFRPWCAMLLRKVSQYCTSAV